MPISKASLKTSWRILLKLFLDLLVLIALADISIAILWDAFYWLICKDYFFSFAKKMLIIYQLANSLTKLLLMFV